MNEVAPDMVTETGLKDSLRKGLLIQVVCREEPEQRYNAWYGNWIVRVVTEDGTVEQVLVTDREKRKKEAEIRQFKTAVGIISFLVGLGSSGICLPVRAGESMLQPPNWFSQNEADG